MSKYDFLNYLGVFALLLYNLYRFRQHQNLSYGYLRIWAAIRREKGYKDPFCNDIFCVFVNIVLVSAFQYGPTPIVNNLFGNLVGTGANYFGLLFISPIILLLYCWIMKIEAVRQIDIVVPAYPLSLFFAKLACNSAGCCGGIPWQYGQMNSSTEIREFPIQLLEAAVAFSIFLFFLRKQKQLKPGTAYPVYMMLYSGIRFFTEFLRSDSNLLWIFKKYHFLCLIGFAVGAIVYSLILWNQKKHPIHNRSVKPKRRRKRS